MFLTMAMLEIPRDADVFRGNDGTQLAHQSPICTGNYDKDLKTGRGHAANFRNAVLHKEKSSLAAKEL